MLLGPTSPWLVLVGFTVDFGVDLSVVLLGVGVGVGVGVTLVLDFGGSGLCVDVGVGVGVGVALVLDFGGSGLRVVVVVGFGTTDGTGVEPSSQRPPMHVMMYVWRLSRLLFAGAARQTAKRAEKRSVRVVSCMMT